MKLNKALLLLVALVFVAGVGIVVAEDATVAPYTFTVPDGYSVVTSDDTTCALQKDEFNAISFATGVGEDLEAAKQNLISQGNTFVEEKDINYDGMDIKLQSFTKDVGGTKLFLYNYVMFADQGNFVVTVSTNDASFNDDLHADSNPAKVIFDSIKAS